MGSAVLYPSPPPRTFTVTTTCGAPAGEYAVYHASGPPSGAEESCAVPVFPAAGIGKTLSIVPVPLMTASRKPS